MSDFICKSCKNFIHKQNSTLGICTVDKDKPRTINQYAKACDKYKN